MMKGESMKLKILSILGIMGGLYFVVFDQKAYAYLDLVTGSYLLQILVTVMVTVVCTVKVYWAKITLYFNKVFSKKKNTDDKAK